MSTCTRNDFPKDWFMSEILKVQVEHQSMLGTILTNLLLLFDTIFLTYMPWSLCSMNNSLFLSIMCAKNIPLSNRVPSSKESKNHMHDYNFTVYCFEKCHNVIARTCWFQAVEARWGRKWHYLTIFKLINFCSSQDMRIYNRLWLFCSIVGFNLLIRFHFYLDI